LFTTETQRLGENHKQSFHHQGTKSTKKVKRKKLLGLNQTKGFKVLVYLGVPGALVAAPGLVLLCVSVPPW